MSLELQYRYEFERFCSSIALNQFSMINRISSKVYIFKNSYFALSFIQITIFAIQKFLLSFLIAYKRPNCKELRFKVENGIAKRIIHFQSIFGNKQRGEDNVSILCHTPLGSPAFLQHVCNTNSLQRTHTIGHMCEFK